MPRVIKQRKTQEGFTLIEIMVVLVILGALAVISVPVYSNYVRRAKISEAISNVDAFATASRIYRMEKGYWPRKSDLTQGTYTKVVDVDENYFSITWSDPSTSTNSTSPLQIIITSNKFDASGAFKYTLDTNYKGTWSDTTGALLQTYAPYLVPSTTTN
jgi:prepilin-type N-terminal cleavage/methylation domain-containing protein